MSFFPEDEETRLVLCPTTGQAVRVNRAGSDHRSGSRAEKEIGSLERAVKRRLRYGWNPTTNTAPRRLGDLRAPAGHVLQSPLGLSTQPFPRPPVTPRSSFARRRIQNSWTRGASIANDNRVVGINTAIARTQHYRRLFAPRVTRSDRQSWLLPFTTSRRGRRY